MARFRNDSRLPEDFRPSIPPAGRFVGAVFGLVFFGIGITVLVFLWGTPFDEFGSPPLFFRIFGSFIAIAFVAIGGTVAVGSIKGKVGPNPQQLIRGAYTTDDDESAPPADTASTPGYRCPHCGAPLADGADVSPHGDVKCTYCNAWFNIHRK